MYLYDTEYPGELSSAPGICILDPLTLRLVFRASHGLARMSWGSLASCGKLVAYLPQLCLRLTFARNLGEWRVEAKDMENRSDPGSGCLTPDGSTLITSRANWTKGASLYHHRFKCSQEYVIAGDLAPRGASVEMIQHRLPSIWPYASDDRRLDIAWNPLPSSWPGVYACKHPCNPARGAGQYLRLVDAKAHRLLGSWSGSDLACMTGRRAARKDKAVYDFETISWSRDGRHIAAFCLSRNIVFILMFS